MNDFNYITNSEKLTAFLDGELPTAEAESLFFDVAASPTLQEELRQQLIISKSFKNSLIAPPPALKSAILMKTNFVNAGSTAASVSVISKMLSNKVVLVLSSAAIACISTALFFLYFYNADTSITANSQFPIANNEILTSEPPPMMSSVLIEDDGESNTPIIPIPSSEKSATKTSRLYNDELLSQQNNSSQEFYKQEHFAVNFADHSPMPIELKRTDNASLPNVFKYESIEHFLSRVNLQFRLTGAMPLNDIDLEPINEPLLNNFAIAIMYELSPEHSVGFELGQENFLQEFNGIENDIPVLWKQNYIGFWSGVAYQYSMQTNSTLQPFARAFLGGTRVGPIAKATIGANYVLSSQFSTFIGWENTGLFYQYQGYNFSSFKSGITAGMKVKF